MNAIKIYNFITREAQIQQNTVESQKIQSKVLFFYFIAHLLFYKFFLVEKKMLLIMSF
jgi:hypothetical protein